MIATSLKGVYRLGPRQYGDSCPVGSALNLIGDRWTLPLLKEMQFGDRRFSDLMDSLPGLSARALSLRLTQLEERQLVVRARLPDYATINVYRLTERGRRIRTMVVEIVRWAVECGVFDPSDVRSGSSLAVSLLAMFRGEEFSPARVRIAFLGPQMGFALEVQGKAASVSHIDPSDADLQIWGSVGALANYLFGRASLQQLVDSRGLNYAGDHDLMQRLPDWFTRPASAVN